MERTKFSKGILAIPTIAFVILIGVSSFTVVFVPLRPSTIFSTYGIVKYSDFIRITRQPDGTWLFINKNGKLFYSLGVTAVTCNDRPLYKQNVLMKYGSLEAWGTETLGRIESWNFNTIGTWSQEKVLHKGLPHCTLIDIGTYAHNHGIPLNRFNIPDVFDTRWAALASEAAHSLITSDMVNDDSLMGYFIANDLFFARWSPVQSESFNEDMFSDDIDRLLDDQAPTDAAKARLIALNYDYHEWLKEYAELYYRTVVEAIKTVDPNHLILGSRGLGVYLPKEDLEGQKCLDTISLNLYDYLQYDASFQHATIEQLKSYYNWSGRPIIITEWSVRSRECDIDVTNAAGFGPIVETQDQRGEYYEKTLSDISSLPFLVGMHWFMWTDKIADGENSCYGLVRVNDDPYEFVSEVIASNLATLTQRGSS